MKGTKKGFLEMNIFGLVLCGGKSTRMGKDKGMMKNGSKTWSQRAEAVMLDISIPVFISVNSDQVAKYKRFHKEESLIVDSNSAGGPLSGILSCHEKFPDADILVLASDMIFMKSPALDHLVGMSSLHPAADVVAFESNFLQTLCAVYKAAFLQELSEKFSAGQLNNFSLQHLVRSANLLRIQVKEQEEELFRNCNYKIDIYEQTH